mmetsp:Transcript_10700/g.16935  ORF Transcript_10700/g.16935 Transcript_10700/m.16935 type:complete len:177 (+) Transcript_10700:27-557(+)
MALRPRRVNVEMNKVGSPGRALQQGWTMHEPAAAGDLTTCLRLLQQGADFNQTDEQCGWTPLRFAVQYGHVKIVEMLIKTKADVNTRFSSNKTALHQACYSGNQEICELLLKAGAQVNGLDDAGFSPYDLIYCPKDAVNELGKVLATYGGKRARTLEPLTMREEFVYTNEEEEEER